MSRAQPRGAARRAGLTACAALALLATQLHAATLFDPALRFRTIATEHFVIYFHPHEKLTASRLAAIAEETWRAVASSMSTAPSARTHVVLADQTDLANGYATPVPYDTIVIFPTWPAGSEFIGNVDDWLRVAFTHEFTHIVHLDRSEGWARWVRGIFGRVTLAFPNLFLPTWQIEGLATYEESALGGAGRVHAGDFTAVVDEAARHGAAEPLDRVNGGLTDWPGGSAPYAYGAGFHEYLAERFGVSRLADLATATARAVPYTGSRAFEQVFGERLGDLWREYESTLPASAARTEGARITHHGFVVVGPRFDRLSPRDVWYSIRTPDEFPALYRVNIDSGRSIRVANRYLGSTTAPGRNAVYFDQQELRRNVGLYSDLYRLERSTGRVTALTREARLMDPDLSPDASTIAAVQDAADARSLVLVRLRQGIRIEPLIADPDTQFNAPRWSPDGGRLAVERHRGGALSEVVIVDATTGTIRATAAIAGARVVTPAWRPDGRAIVAAAAREGEPFNLVEFAVDGSSPPRQLTHTTGGATWPDISPDGRTIVFVGYTPSGFDLFAIPYPSESEALRQSGGSDRRDLPARREGEAARSDKPYSPWPTLRPTSWSPLVVADSSQVRAGVGVGGVDVLGYHSYFASATWLVSGPADAARQPASPDWQLTYVYDRWRPTWYATASSTTSFFAGPPTEAGTPSNATLSQREIEGGVLLPFRHAHTSHTALVAAVRSVDEYTVEDDVFQRNRTAIRAAWATNTALTYGYSVSPERGITAGGTIEVVRRSLGSFADATTATGDARLYVPGAAPHHVIALRGAVGVSTGDATVGRTFLLGGSGTDLGVASFGSSAIGLLRGFAANTFAGRRAAVVNADYRLPLARPQRGVGTWPLFVHTLHAAVFVDAGNAWGADGFRGSAIKTSMGGELATSIVAGYVFPFTIAGGIAWGHDPTRVVGSGAMAYFRVGKAF